jgi:hypothetical protein
VSGVRVPPPLLATADDRTRQSPSFPVAYATPVQLPFAWHRVRTRQNPPRSVPGALPKALPVSVMGLTQILYSCPLTSPWLSSPGTASLRPSAPASWRWSRRPSLPRQNGSVMACNHPRRRVKKYVSPESKSPPTRVRVKPTLRPRPKTQEPPLP